jgi:diguanylate cyclase (GGDEF)-like protein
MLQVNPILISVFFGITMLNALVMLYVWRIHFAERAVAYWTLGLVFVAVAAGILRLHRSFPVGAAPVLTSFFAVAGSCGLTLGMAAFVGRREPRCLAMGTCGAVLAGVFYWSVVDDNMAARSLLYAAGILLSSGLSIFYLLAPSSRSDGRARFAVAGVAMLILVGTICRALFALPRITDYFAIARVRVGEIWLIDIIVVQILLPVGLLLMTSERLLRDLERQARHDGLTGILNRRAFLERAEEESARACRHGRPAGLLMLDIDHFKRVNDTNGHHAGDELLQGVVAAIKATLRKEDLFCRFGGEEFCLLLPEMDLSGASRFAERIRGVVARLMVPFGDRELNVTISIGAAVIGAHQPSIRLALDAADRALYRAKTNGRNRIEVEQGEG